MLWNILLQNIQPNYIKCDKIALLENPATRTTENTSRSLVNIHTYSLQLSHACWTRCRQLWTRQWVLNNNTLWLIPILLVWSNTIHLSTFIVMYNVTHILFHTTWFYKQITPDINFGIHIKTGKKLIWGGGNYMKNIPKTKKIIIKVCFTVQIIWKL